ncbi:MAG: hypothetical protein ACKVZJ_02870 [Phycisphaerales bacterium]
MLAAFFAAPACIAAVPAYGLVGSFELPLGAGAFDVAPDGRVVAIRGGEIFTQDAPSASAFTKAGSVPGSLINAFGASFLRVSPGGGRIAVGDGNSGGAASVLLVDVASLNPSADSPVAPVVSANYDAAWASEGTLLVTGANFGIGSFVNRVSVDTLSSATVLTGVGDGSGGVALRGGRAFVGAGFDLTPGAGVETGDIRAFDAAVLLSTATPIDFGSAGTLAARALSGAFLAFDGVGSLIVGGGDFFGESGFASVIDGAAIDAALAGGPFATSANGVTLAPAGSQFYSTTFNALTNEVLVRAFGDDTVFRYAVPAPSVMIMALFGGVFAHRRRRG